MGLFHESKFITLYLLVILREDNFHGNIPVSLEMDPRHYIQLTVFQARSCHGLSHKAVHFKGNTGSWEGNPAGWRVGKPPRFNTWARRSSDATVPSKKAACFFGQPSVMLSPMKTTFTGPVTASWPYLFRWRGTEVCPRRGAAGREVAATGTRRRATRRQGPPCAATS